MMPTAVGQLNIDEFFIHSHKYVSALKHLLDTMDRNVVFEFINALVKTRDRGGIIYFAGNGGSAATASHFTQDLAEISNKINTPAFKTYCLNENVPRLTALANDYGYEHVFSMQLKDRFTDNDLLVVLSASGNSPNIIRTAELAKERGGHIVGLLGFDGGKLKEMCDIVIHAKTDKWEYGIVEDIHLIVNHIIFFYLKAVLCPTES